MIAYTVGASHHGDNSGQAWVKTSTDGGVTFGSGVLVSSSTTKWISARAISQPLGSRIFVTAFENVYPADPPQGAYVNYSDDNGATWKNISITSSFTSFVYMSGSVVADKLGNLHVTVEGKNTGDTFASIHALTSTDKGLTWGSEVLVANGQTLPAGSNYGYSEANLLLLDTERMLCFTRLNNVIGTITMQYSDDNGATWSSPVNKLNGYAYPECIQMASKTLVVVTGYPSGGTMQYPRLVGLYTSLDRGNTWQGPFIVDPTALDTEYGGAVETTAGNLFLVYGVDHSQNQSHTAPSYIRSTTLTEGAFSTGVQTVQTRTPLYDVTLLGSDNFDTLNLDLSGYDDLEFDIKGKSVGNAGYDAVMLAFNGDTTVANYYEAGTFFDPHDLPDYGYGSTYKIGMVSGSDAAAGQWGNVKGTIPLYASSTAYKNAFSTFYAACASPYLGLSGAWGMTWNYTTPITRLTFTTQQSPYTFPAGSRCRIFGVKNAPLIGIK
jgi:hypothetical protein